ncbi:MAG: hypothetical protein EXX96DRAFT_558171, partial [Benjaminiella poitrasii]
PNFFSVYTFAFLLRYQLSFLKLCKDFNLDATYGVTSIEKGILYTVVVRHPNTETGFPVAYCFTTDHSSEPIIEFLTFLKINGMNPNKITIYVSKTELLAIEMVFPSVCRIREHIVRQGSVTMNNKTLQNQVMKDLKVLVHSEIPILFSQILTAFLLKYSEFTSFIQYFKQKYLDNNWYKH